MPACAVRGLGFDATCSMVVLDSDGNPISVNVDGNILFYCFMATAELPPPPIKGLRNTGNIP